MVTETTWSTRAMSAAAASTAVRRASEVSGAPSGGVCRTTGWLPEGGPGKASAASRAAWLSLPGMTTASLVARPCTRTPAATASSTASQTARTRPGLRAQLRPRAWNIVRLFLSAVETTCTPSADLRLHLKCNNVKGRREAAVKRTPEQGEGPVADGRTERGRQTRERIADALLALLDEGVTEFPAEKVAAYAGVSRRSVFHHFTDMSQLVDTAITRRLEQLAEQVRPLPTSGPRVERVAALVEQRARILEWITPARLAVMRLDHPSPRIQQVSDEAFAEARSRLEAVLAQELDALAGPRRADLLNGLDAVTTWGAWHHWRTTGLGPEEARRAMEATVLALLASADHPVPGGDEVGSPG